MRDLELRHALIDHFAEELRDRAVAEAFVSRIGDALLCWTPPSQPADRIDTIVVYGFGNRVEPDGRVVPGPMNEQLAAATRVFVEQHAVPVYAQWEVADVLAASVRAIAIHPDVDAEGKEIYLSTEGVANKVVALAHAGGRELGRVGVIAWRDHAVRCVATSRRAGMDAAVPEGLELPADYDSDSGQPWTRARPTYLAVDLLARLAMLG